MRVWRRPHDRPAAVPRRGLTRSINGRAPRRGFPHAGPKEGKEVSLTRWVAGSPLDAGRDAFAPLSNRLTGRPVTVQLR